MRSLLLCALVPLCAGFAKTSWRDLQANAVYSFDDYLQEYGKSYSASEYIRRRAIFEANVRTIRAHNSDATQSWKMGLNQFADWEDAEVVQKRTGLNRQGAKVPGASRVTLAMEGDVPVSVDWREKENIVTPVKNQGSCGSCWAFGATETLESAAAIVTGKLQVLAPQQYTSCSTNPNHCGGTGGCSGSTAQLAFNYSAEHGLVLETSYPYTAKTGTCDTTKTRNPVVKHTGYVELKENDYNSLVAAVATKGPIAISVAASAWSLYEEGVYDSAKCGYEMNHIVSLVGYGTDKGQGYWIVRNSWGASWGESGYIRLARFGDGKEPCGMDKKPMDGVACKGETDPIQYCGICAMLGSSSYPTGVTLA